jgi:hypothetical protein
MSAVTESDRLILFTCNHLADRKVIADDCHPLLTKVPASRHGFWLFDRGMTAPIQFGALKLR